MTFSILAASLSVVAASSYAEVVPDDTTVVLKEVTVSGQQQRNYLMRTSQTAIQVSHDYLQQHFSGSLMQTLEGIPGVKAMTIGSGQSKPVIRGLGFNRMVVSEDGVKHEGQQWGDDHGLEIDQFAVDRAEVVKGPAALLYGSDAIGGVLNLYTNHIPTEPLSGNIQVFGRSNNEQVGLTAKLGGRHGNWFYRLGATLIDYADYRVPTDSIQYYSYWIKLKDQRLRNTAGCERDGSVTLGYAGYRFHTDVRVSDSYMKSGFFANAHGLEVRLSNIDYDQSRRDVDLPYQWVNHLKVLSHTSWQADHLRLEANLAWQNNHREELTEPVSHGYMPRPEGSLERRFVKNTLTANLGMMLKLSQRHELSVGLNSEYQHNRRGGWGFIIPDFETTSMGLYAIDRYTISDQLKWNAGFRMDHAHTHIDGYRDWFPTPTANGEEYKERSANIDRYFNSLTWSTGVSYGVDHWVLKANVGKSYRVPIPKELGADGVNYHIFRYERGNANLDPEESYQLDLGIHWDNDAFCVQLDPYVNYFPNYIYLNPTSQYVEGLQLYHYTQARVLRYGVEAQATWVVNAHWETELKGEYLYARQQSGQKKGYTLPFSTPWSIDADAKYSFQWLGDNFVGVNAHIVGAQHEIVPPEKPTDGHWTLNLSAGKQVDLKSCKLDIALHADNLLNRRYYDHTSYYRLIDVPEPGRNMSLMVGLTF
ncbi:TonB-dependent receptor [Prevotella sp. E13-17]|uniref:TonB-dependent receptor n=1 Tax=Prevotella sp. E13-17 TaxID=2913616 RepID=UPI001EDB3933|nr:TonB-dependent receptor [Prevotella sp. E13-17]UKK50445.1 TonB-dependent receptor [Prevotella sp. E13-17]